MYANYYNLKAMPFQITTDPRFLWLGDKHSEALATLKYGIIENKGFLLLTGDVGMGKLAQPVRVAVTGTSISPGIYETLVALGKLKTVGRIDDTIRHMRANATEA